MNSMILIVAAAVLCGIILGYLFRFMYARNKLNSAEQDARKIMEEAKREAEAKKKEGMLEVRDEMHRVRVEFEKETHNRRVELQALEKRLMQREESMDRKADILEQKEVELDKKDKRVISREKWLNDESQNLTAVKEEQKKVMERLARMSQGEAKKLLLSRMEEEARKEGLAIIKKVEQETLETADRKAKKILSHAMQRCAAEYTAEITVSTVPLPDDEMKGRIIGREGRNIRAFETATGVDVIIDDTPEAITLSAFDGVRREIARVSLERLIADGRIHPARIEEIVEKAKKEMEVHLKEVGEQAAIEFGLQNLNHEIAKMIGRLRYRTSYGQSVLQHSTEVAKIAGVMASELGLDVKFAWRAGLFHDIGKAIDRDVEGTHAQIGADLLKKYNESPRIINAVAAHHEDCPAETIEAILIQSADAVSAARPGARRESLEYYLKRLENLEKIATSFQGVEKAYAIQAGREVRIIVTPESVDDNKAYQLARDIARKIETEMQYPGQIKVTVIREVRSVEVAK